MKILIEILIGVGAMGLWIYFLRSAGQRVNFCMRKGLELSIDKGEAEKEWSRLSWSGEDPFRVVMLASFITKKSDIFQRMMCITSSLYSQVKHLVKRGRIFSAMAFFMESRACSAGALVARKDAPEKNPIDLEILGAPDFMLSQIPVLGNFFGFKASAIDFLEEADAELSSPPKDPLMASLIWSKLWKLTENPTYRERVRRAGLGPEMVDVQLGRIAKHMGFGNTEELLKFCGAKLAVVM